MARQGYRDLAPDDPIYDWYERNDLVEDLTPIHLVNGTRVDSITMTCRTCRQNALPGEARGELVPLDATYYLLTIVGLCRTCRVLNRTVCKIGPAEGTYLVQDVTTQYPDPFLRKGTDLKPAAN